MNQNKGFQKALWNAVEKFQDASVNIETNLIPLFHEDASVEDQKDLKLMAQKQIVNFMELALKSIGLEIDVWSNVSPIRSQTEDTKDDSIIIVDLREPDNVKIPSQNASREGTVENEPPEIFVNDDDDDDDVTLFLPGEPDSTKTCDNKNTSGENKTTDTEVNNNLSSEHISDDVEMTNTDTVPCNKTVRTEIVPDKDSNNPNADFQDTPTSIPDYRDYNENKQLLTSSDQSLPMTNKPKWVEQWLETLPEKGASVPNSQESLCFNNHSYSDFDDDNISSISQFRKVQRTPQTNLTRKSVVTPVINEDSNKENLPVNGTVEKTPIGNEILENENEGLGNKNTLEKNDDCSSNVSTDAIQIVKDLDTEAVVLPILLNTDEVNANNHSSDMFNVERVEDDQTISCFSINLLKKNTQRVSDVLSDKVKSKTDVVKEKVDSSKSIENIDLTENGDDVDDDGLSREIDDILNASSAGLPSKYNRNTIHQNTIEDNPRMQSEAPATETCAEIPSDNNDVYKNNNGELIDTIKLNVNIENSKTDKAPRNVDSINNNVPNMALGTVDSSTNVTNKSRNFPEPIDLILSSDDELEEEITCEEPKYETEIIGGPDGYENNQRDMEKNVEIENAEENLEACENDFIQGSEEELPCNDESRNAPITLYDDASFKQESLHIIDDYTMNSSQAISILSHGGNFIENDDDDDRENDQDIIKNYENMPSDNIIGMEEYEVIPSVKVEVIMKEENDIETTPSQNEPMRTENSSSNSSIANKISKKSKRKTKMKGPLSVRNKRFNPVHRKQSTKRKKCQLGITSATKVPLEVNSENSSKDSDYVFKKPGPKSKTTPKKDALRETNVGRDTTSDDDREINRLTSLSSLNKPPTSGIRSSKKVRRKKTPLLDFHKKNRNASSSQESDQTEAESQHPLRLSLLNQNVEAMAKRNLLDTDEESLLSSLPPLKRNKNLGVTEPKKNAKQTPSTPSKAGPSWRKDPLLTGRLDSLPARKSTSRTKVNPKNDVDNDDVRSVCSQIQEEVKNPVVKEELQKLLEERETCIPLICISSDEEENEIDEILNDEENDDLNSVLDEENERQLVLEFKKTATNRKERVSSVQKRARKLLTRSRVHTESNGDVTTFEDRYNDTPPLVLDMDEESRVMVSVCPFFSKIFKDHQKRGVQFMWDTCFGSKKKVLDNDKGSGCILAHDMGLGKSVQVISLVHTLNCMEDIAVKKILILSPKSLVQNWEEEINKWTKGLRVKLSVFTWTNADDIIVQDIHEWSAYGGVYIFSYKLFVSICKKTHPVDFQKFFLNPGADLVIFDEGHLLKNSRTETYKCLSKFQTRRRIALTGTPIQNNLNELYNIVTLVQPDFMSKEKFREQFCNPISCGQNDRATTYQKNLAAKRIACLHRELEKVMDREQGNQEAGLPPKLNYDIFLKLEPLQEKLVEFFYDRMRQCFIQAMIFPSVRLAEMLSIHPKSLQSAKPVETLCKGKEWSEELKKGHDWHEDLKGAWWKNVLNQDEIEQLNAIETGVKIKLTFQIVEHAVQKKEKVLIFCSSIQILDLLQSFFEQKAYVKNVNFFRMDGHVTMNQRKKYLNIFNDENNSEAKIFLVTHKVGGVGLNFTGANRIIILDMPWNPAHHEQSSNRTHRLGQKKTSYIYRLITKGTLEESIYKTTISKQSLSKRVVDKKKIKTLFRGTDTFDFKYLRPRELRRDLRPSKDDLLNEIIQNVDEMSMIHSYSEQGELFELSEDQLNEGQAYEEYLMESRNFDIPGEKKRKRKAKDPPQEDATNVMMSRDHLQNYNHAELLSWMQMPDHPNFQTPSTSYFHQEPINLLRTRDTIRMMPPPPPPLVPISRPKFRKIQETNPPVSQSIHNENIEKNVKANQVERTGPHVTVERLPMSNNPNTIHTLPNSSVNSPPNNATPCKSLSEFINTVRQQQIAPNSNMNANSIRTLEQQLANKPEINVSYVVKQGGQFNISSSNGGAQLNIRSSNEGGQLNETDQLKIISSNEDQATNSTSEVEVTVQKKAKPPRRLSVNPNIFIEPPLTEEQERGTSLANQTYVSDQNTFKSHPSQLPPSNEYQQPNQKAKKRHIFPESLDVSQVPAKQGRVETNPCVTPLIHEQTYRNRNTVITQAPGATNQQTQFRLQDIQDALSKSNVQLKGSTPVQTWNVSSTNSTKDLDQGSPTNIQLMPSNNPQNVNAREIPTTCNQESSHLHQSELNTLPRSPANQNVRPYNLSVNEWMARKVSPISRTTKQKLPRKGKPSISHHSYQTPKKSISHLATEAKPPVVVLRNVKKGGRRPRWRVKDQSANYVQPDQQQEMSVPARQINPENVRQRLPLNQTTNVVKRQPQKPAQNLGRPQTLAENLGRPQNQAQNSRRLPSQPTNMTPISSNRAINVLGPLDQRTSDQRNRPYPGTHTHQMPLLNADSIDYLLDQDPTNFDWNDTFIKCYQKLMELSRRQSTNF